MLPTLNFRTKLLAILIVPVVGLVAVTGFAVSDRKAEADASAGLRARIDVVAAAEAVGQQVRLEEGLSGKEVATGDRSVTERQRAATDLAIANLRAAIQSARDAGSPAFTAAVDRLNTNLTALTTSYRSSVDFGSDASFFLTSYTNVLTNISNLVNTVADEADNPQLSRETAALAALSRAANATAGEWAVLQVSFTRKTMAITEASELKATVTERDRWLGVFEGLAIASDVTELRSQLAGQDAQQVEAYESNALAAVDDPAVHLDGDASMWEAAMRGRISGFADAAVSQINTIDQQAVRIHNAAADSLTRFVILAGAIVALSVLLALLLARAVTRPLRRLTAAAQELADVQLPNLVTRLRTPNAEDQHYLVATIQPIDIRSEDEIGKLADAFNTVQAVAVDVAAEQADLLRKGISDIFVNLARRNQVLIDRQIEFLDELEAAEHDPDQLGQLYRLDHLATRMRRNAESLLVLAGMEPGRKRTRPVALVDVVRAAIGEVEDYARVDLAGFDEVDVTGSAAVALGHLLAELLENATHFSPPTSRVIVEGRVTPSGYDVTVTDAGIGMSDEQLADANALLASPPPVGLELTRSLGFTVIGRLAVRFGVAVRLAAGGEGAEAGVVAAVHLPSHLVVTPDAPAEVTPEPEPEALALPELETAEPWEPEWPDDVVPANELLTDDLVVGALDDEAADETVLPTAGASGVVDAVPTLEHAVPHGARFDQGLADLLRGDERLGTPALIEPPVDAPPAVTASGLARRQPKPITSVDEVGAAGDGPRPPIAPGHRSPDEVRQLLARYRTGLQRGRTSDGPAEETEEFS